MIGRVTSKASKPRNRAQFNLRGRLLLVTGALGLCSLALVGRAVDLQIVDNAFYREQGNEGSCAKSRSPPRAG